VNDSILMLALYDLRCRWAVKKPTINQSWHPQKALPYARTRRLSHQPTLSVQRFSLQPGQRKQRKKKKKKTKFDMNWANRSSGPQETDPNEILQRGLGTDQDVSCDFWWFWVDRLGGYVGHKFRALPLKRTSPITTCLALPCWHVIVETGVPHLQISI
jgi:hypothetical protein